MTERRTNPTERRALPLLPRSFGRQRDGLEGRRVNRIHERPLSNRMGEDRRLRGEKPLRHVLGAKARVRDRENSRAALNDRRAFVRPTEAVLRENYQPAFGHVSDPVLVPEPLAIRAVRTRKELLHSVDDPSLAAERGHDPYA